MITTHFEHLHLDWYGVGLNVKWVGTKESADSDSRVLSCYSHKMEVQSILENLYDNL